MGLACSTLSRVLDGDDDSPAGADRSSAAVQLCSSAKVASAAPERATLQALGPTRARHR